MQVKPPRGIVVGDAMVVILSMTLSIFLSQLEKQQYQKQCCSMELNHGTECSETVCFKSGFSSLLSCSKFFSQLNKDNCDSIVAEGTELDNS